MENLFTDVFIKEGIFALLTLFLISQFIKVQEKNYTNYIDKEKYYQNLINNELDDIREKLIEIVEKINE